MFKFVVASSLGAVAATDIVLASFDGADDAAARKWQQQNDPVMGGASSGTFTVAGGAGVMEGTVALIPSLQAPGFIKTSTTDSKDFADVSTCTGMSIVVKSTSTPSPYKGYRLSFGTDSAFLQCGKFFARGFKADFDAPVGEFGEVKIPFNSFTKCWDDATGDAITTCAQDSKFCPSEARLKDLQTLSVWAEGVQGDVKVEFKSISAYGCGQEVSASETCSLYDIDGDSCGQSDLDCLYVGPAKAFRSSLKDGTCAEQGYTVQTGTQTMSVPVIGDITVTQYSKGLAASGQGSLVTFDGAKDTAFTFKELNDPVMGGRSTGTWSLGDGFGILDGEVVDVPSLSAPGFIKAAADGSFPDVSSFIDGSLVLQVRTTTPEYEGFRVSFVSGASSPDFSCAAGGSLPFSRGCFKDKFSVPAGSEFTEVKLPFNGFSDKWSSATGEQTTTCAQSSDVCPTAKKLSAIQRIEFWGEGALGKLHLEVKGVYAENAKGERSLLV